MQERVLAVASGLIDAGVKARDTVAIMSENRVEWLYCDLAIQAIGAVTVPIYPNVSADAAETIITDSSAVLAIVGDSNFAGKLGKTRAITMDGELIEWVKSEPRKLSEIASRLRGIKPDDLSTIVYTSGTTGVPKGVELAHRNLVDTARAAVSVHPITDRDRAVAWLPYSHSYGLVADLMVGLVVGLEAWISRGPDHLVEEIHEVRPTVMNSVPRVYEKMYASVMARVRQASPMRQRIFAWAVGVGARFSQAASPGPVLRAQRNLADRLVLRSIRVQLTGGDLRFFVSGGAGLAREIEEFFWALGVPILNGWGLTETSAATCSNTLHEHRFLTVGKPMPGVELKIASDGEILVKGPGNMLGYHNKPDETADVLKDGWFSSGDIGEIDADGFLKITDRKKSLFKTAGGKYIAPIQLEHLLLSDPIIARAVVVGESRPYVTALIVPDWDAAKAQGMDEAAVRSRVQQIVDRVNAGVGHWETIKYFTLLPADFTEQSGELSLKLDVKRKVVSDHYQKQIESMYTEKPKPA
jgi:long-chain acyl-CoA synthetase